ncbi:RNA polymerase sigma factor [Enhygromyxa salina]|uniref:RNA polymerase sigma factor n=1 Tax=Enhygromyxa salina TaxID=215803 RepID=A0A2S9YC32_9BACT|nr:sigma-70 family RNA polymerase sigma factor [Enhygromyxa salina]PRQ02659.1 RNA polymerase sigma factor [Enhygromyxa salina]
MTEFLSRILTEPLAFTSPLTEPLPLTSMLLGNTVFVVIGGLTLLALLGLPLLRGLGMLIGTTRWLVGRAPMLWARRMSVADPERPLTLTGLSPQLASLARQTRTLALELRRRSQEARHWPDDAAELEAVRMTWWRSFTSDTLDFTPLTDTRREVFDWLQSAQSLGERDRESLTALGIDVEAVREALTAQGHVAEHVRTLAGLLWTIDERLAGATSRGYRATGHQAGAGAGVVVPFTLADDPADDEDTDDTEAARRRRFAAVVDEQGAGLARMAGSYARSQAEREDLEQDIALALWQSLPKFRGEASLSTFANKVARYCCYRYVRRRGRLPTDADALVNLRDPDSGVEARLLEADARAQVEQALAELPDSLESTLSLHLSGLSYAEIAQRLGISERNVSVRLTRARHRLRAQLTAA